MRTEPGPLRQVLRPEQGRLLAAIGLQAVASVAGLVPLIAVAQLGAVLLADGTTDGAAAWRTVAVAGVAVLVSLLATSAASAVSHVADNDLQLRLRRALAARLGRVPLGWFSTRTSGQVKKVVHDDVHTLHHLVAHAALDLTAAAVTPLAALAYLAIVDWRLALLCLLPLLAGAALFARAMRDAGSKMPAYGRAANEINSGAVEFVDGIAVVKTFGRAGAAHRRFTAAAESFHAFFAGWVRETSNVTSASQLVVSPPAVLVLVLSAGGAMVAAGWLPPADLLPFALLAPALAAPMSGIGGRVQALRTGAAAAASVTGMLAEPVMPEPAQPKAPADSTIRLRGVGYAYGDRPVLHDVDLDLRPGTVTALVGRSGAGKSTLAKLVPRFLDVTEGTITLGGVDLRELDPDTLHRTVGFVFQEVGLLRASVADNIRLGRPEADLPTVIRAARAAQIHDRIMGCPNGYDTVVDAEVAFSGGERQRIAIARALLADPPVLVLDEATAYADPGSEARIQRALSHVAAGRTVLVVAHRLATVRHADQIVVLDAGRVVERGRHDDLLDRDGRYARMWRAQSDPTLSTSDPGADR